MQLIKSHIVIIEMLEYHLRKRRLYLCGDLMILMDVNGVAVNEKNGVMIDLMILMTLIAWVNLEKTDVANAVKTDAKEISVAVHAAVDDTTGNHYPESL